MVGPSIVGLLSNLVPMIHFFTLDAVSFVASAASVHSIGEHVPPARGEARGAEDGRGQDGAARASFAQAVASGFQTVRAQPGMTFIMSLKAFTGGTWNLAFTLGIALLVQHLAPGDARAFGLVMAGYGAGNFAGALYYGNHHRPHPGRLMFSGYIQFGLGFLLVGISPSIGWMIAAAAFSGYAGPMNELAFSDTIQSRFPLRDISRVFRLRMAVETSSTLFFTGISPLLFRLIGVRGTIAFCGGAWVLSGLLGFFQLKTVEAHEQAAEERRVRSLREAGQDAAAAQAEAPIH